VSRDEESVDVVSRLSVSVVSSSLADSPPLVVVVEVVAPRPVVRVVVVVPRPVVRSVPRSVTGAVPPVNLSAE